MPDIDVPLNAAQGYIRRRIGEGKKRRYFDYQINFSIKSLIIKSLKFQDI
jgi:hypothetical protein